MNFTNIDPRRLESIHGKRKFIFRGLGVKPPILPKGEGKTFAPYYFLNKRLKSMAPNDIDGGDIDGGDIDGGDI